MGRSQPWEGLRGKYSGGRREPKPRPSSRRSLGLRESHRNPCCRRGRKERSVGRWEGAGLRGCGGVGLVSAWPGCGVVQVRKEKGVSLRLSDFLLGYTLH